MPAAPVQKAPANTKEKLFRIINDPQKVVGREAALKRLRPAQEVACAIRDLDVHALPISELDIVMNNGCPTQEQVAALKKARDENLELALPEQYMWVISQIPAFQARLDCWYFLRTYADRCDQYVEGLTQFQGIAECFRKSKELPSLLGLILAVGNYINGGTDRGQADGFDLDVLGKLETIKDARGKDLRDLILSVFFSPTFYDKASKFIEDLAPVFRNVVRGLAKDSDGEKLTKRVVYTFEDYDQCITTLQKELNEKHETMTMVLSCFDDPADPFKLEMPEQFDQAKAEIAKVVAQRDAAKDKYLDLLGWFKAAQIKSDSFCRLWDDFFVPEALITNRPQKLKKEVLTPAFCLNKPVTADNLMILWGLKQPANADERKGKTKPDASSPNGDAKPLRSRTRTKGAIKTRGLSFSSGCSAR
eukprot:gnl/TRDRNA2_/TRDRNA2_157466_c4_seq2.p1 gnl/TRDRNA2_/TRDRNA2_157466_c4~~gnl/TRDRNA2_/TRDRNA2_157466_c4_seq2.p1  ORF type:complete len:431 (-),score=102.58 gnl/TRDRNA2_/TRDRNA2_157466_c4_seq2:310-1569(-)